MDSIRALYVEDEAADRDLTRRHLERHAPHISLVTADTLAEALQRLTRGDIDVVLSDYRLPDGTGLDFLHMIKAAGFRVPVVLVTAWGDAEDAVRLLKAGAADYVAKRGDYVTTLAQVLEGAFAWFQLERERTRTALRVLYAEHEPVDLALTQKAFREHGPHLQLETVARGQEALARLRVSAYDVFLLDYRLPDLSGIEVLKAMREQRIKLPVVMVTGQGDEETAVQAFKLGVDDYIVKRGAYLAKLPSTLENVLAQRRLGDEKDSLLVLNDLARSIAAASELETLVQRAAAAATDLLKVDISMLWLRHGHELTPTAWVGIEDAAAERLRLTPDEGLLRLAAADRRVTVADFGPGGEGPETAALLRPTATLAVSLVTGGRVVGLLAVASRSPRIFAAAEERLLTILSDHTAIALENVRLYQELKDRLAALHRAQAQLLQTEKVAAMGQLLAGVAHELSSPLSVVTGRASLLYEQLAGTPPADQAAKIVDAAARCGRIVTNFLALARQHPPERESVRLNQVVRDALELLAYQLRVDSVQVHLDLADELPVLWADGHQLHQVIVNLISNAYQAMRESPGPRRLAISTRHDLRAARVALEVTDNGPGIPAEIQRRIFEPFFTTKPADQGTGLGLSLCQGVVEAHEGSIGLTSQPGAGTTFRIELPVKDRPTLPAEAEPMATPAPVTGKTILVVDDEAVIATMLADMLSADGHVVHTAPNGRVALQKLTEQRYDLVLSDVRMPELDGPGLWRELERTQPALLRRFIFLTGDALNRQTMEFLEGAGAHKLGKPAMLADVHRVTQEVLRVPVPDAESPERA